MKQQPIEELDCIGLVHNIMKHGMWAFREQFGNIFITEYSASALSLIVGAIHGVWQRDQERAAKLAQDFCKNINYLTVHEMVPINEHMPHWKVPNRVFHMTQAGYLSLGFAQYAFRTHSELDEIITAVREAGGDKLKEFKLIDDNGNRCSIDDCRTLSKGYYVYSGNGGINLRQWDYHTHYPVPLIGEHDGSYRDWSVNT